MGGLLRRAIEERKKLLIRLLVADANNSEQESELSQRPLSELEEEYSSRLKNRSQLRTKKV